MSYYVKLALICLTLALGLAVMRSGGLPRTNSGYTGSALAQYSKEDCDSVLRLLKVERVHQTGNPGERIIPQIAPPAGLNIHWTAPVDFILASGAKMFRTEKRGFRAALHDFSLWYPQLLFMVLVGVLIFVLKQLGEPAETVPLAFALAALNPFLARLFMPGNTDHHGMQALLGIMLAAAALKFLRSPNVFTLAVAGLLAGLGIWVSVQFLFMAALTLGALASWWLFADRRYWWQPALVPACAAAVLLFALRVEYPGGEPAAPVFDMVSRAHLTLFLFVTAASAAAGAAALKPLGVKAKAALAGALAAITTIVLYKIYPGLFAQPIAEYGGAFYFAYMNECKPLYKLYPASIFIPFIISWLAALGMAAFYAVKGPPDTRAGWRFITLLCAAGGILTLKEFRWYVFCVPFMIPPLAALTQKLAKYFTGPQAPRKGFNWRFAAGTVAALLITGIIPVLCALFFYKETARAGAAIQQAMLTDLETGAITRALGEKPLNVLVDANIAPHFVYFTPHRAVFGNYHRIPDALGVYRAFLDAPTPEAAHETLRRAGVQAIYFSPRLALLPDSQRFAERLRAGAMPPWLKPVPGYHTPDVLLMLVE